MPVAKTYEKLTLQGEPFMENKRMYVYVLAKNGPKKVRWYSDAEYRRKAALPRSYSSLSKQQHL